MEIIMEEKCINDIYGVLYRPNNSKKNPIIIYSHGLGSDHLSGTSYAEILSKKGFAVYLFDFRNGGNTSKSGNDTTKMSVMTEVNDLLEVISEIKKWDFIDKKNIILIGSSQGGLVSAITASKIKDDINGLILLYPGFNIGKAIHKDVSSLDELPDEMDYRGWLILGKKYAEDLWDVDVYKEACGYDKDVLIIHGTDDKIVSHRHSEEANKLFKKSTLKLIENSDHGFYGDSFNIAIKYINDYLDKIK